MVRSGVNSHTRGRNIGLLFVSFCICSSIYVTFLMHTATTVNEGEFSTTHDHLIRLLIDQHYEKHVKSKSTLAAHLLSNTSHNVVFSPLLIDTVLSSVAVGSTGETLEQLLSYLKAESIGDVHARSSQLVSSVLADGSPFGGPRLSYANGIWIDQTLSYHPYFKQAVEILHNAACKQGDFQNKSDEVAAEVNLWAEKQTSGLIKDILHADAVSSEIALILANAVYFKGFWKEKFARSKTGVDEFHRLDGSTVQVPYLTTCRKQILHKCDGFKVLGVPYEYGEDKRRFTMYFYLPDKRDGLQNLVEKIDSESDFLESHIPSDEEEVEVVKIPKFKISFGFEASDVLKELGLELPFKHGGLTKMVNSSMGVENLFISSIHQKSFVEVNEEGAEAAALITLSMFESSVRMDFVASHPFLFVIREDTSGTVLFMGQVSDPSVS